MIPFCLHLLRPSQLLDCYCADACCNPRQVRLPILYNLTFCHKIVIVPMNPVGLRIEPPNNQRLSLGGHDTFYLGVQSIAIGNAWTRKVLRAQYYASNWPMGSAVYLHGYTSAASRIFDFTHSSFLRPQQTGSVAQHSLLAFLGSATRSFFLKPAKDVNIFPVFQIVASLFLCQFP